MWFPRAKANSLETAGKAYVAPSAHLTNESERLVPVTSNDIIEISDLKDYYARLDEQNKNLYYWGFFRNADYNFAVCRPLSFLLQPRPLPTKENTGVRVVDHRAHEETAGVTDSESSEMLLLTAATATMTEPSEAVRIGEKILVPGIVCSYTNVDVASGYSGYKAWVLAEGAQKPEDTFFLPEITPHTATPKTGELNRLREAAPDLGFISTRQLLAVPSRLSEVSPADRVVLE